MKFFSDFLQKEASFVDYSIPVRFSPGRAFLASENSAPY